MSRVKGILKILSISVSVNVKTVGKNYLSLDEMKPIKKEISTSRTLKIVICINLELQIRVLHIKINTVIETIIISIIISIAALHFFVTHLLRRLSLYSTT